MSSKYERELRQVLAGLSKGVEAIIKSCNEIEKTKMRLIEKRPFLVVRAAGSGIEGSGDLLALRGDLCFPIEVKSSKKDKLYLSGRTVDQYNSLVYEGNRSSLLPLYAFRLKGVRGDSWRIFRVETDTLHSKLRQLAPFIPSLPKTRNGKPYLNWNDGLALNEFIALVCSKFSKDVEPLETLQKRTTELSVTIEKSTNQNNKLAKRDILAELLKRKVA
ncbi:MAG TPA: Holliday junction resolvase [Candidatus Poseidoniales archaeon]|nr:MAG TPA: Holliday junction resolvase [Candidatus Poseidoniales archaeon]HII57987.1 Holliday junction resolvase [Candidatus Poseidoniaceae archaeon]